MFKPLVLEGTRPLVVGARRYIFQHPDDERLLVKVLRPEVSTEESTQKVPWIRVRRRHGIYRTYVRQIGEYIRLRARLGDDALPIERVFGIVETDKGLGLVVEKICGRDGKLAPTLVAVVEQQGFSSELEERVNQLRDDVIRKNIITGDLHGANIVAGFDPRRGDHLVIIDGVGDKTFIPVNSMSRYINRRSNVRHFRHVIYHLRLVDSMRGGSDRSARLPTAAEPARGGNAPPG